MSVHAQDFDDFGFFDADGFSTAVNSWNERVIANGGTTDLTISVALDQFDRDISAFRDKIFRLNFFIGADLNSVIIPFYYNLDNSSTPLGNSTDVNNNFVSGDYSTTTGLLGNGSTKYLATGFNPNSVTQMDLNSAGVVVFTHTADAGDYEDVATTDGTNSTRINPFIGATSTRGIVHASTTHDRTNSGNAGFYAVIRQASTTTKTYEAGVQIGLTSAVASVAKPNSEINIFRRGGTGVSYSPRRLKGYAITAGLTDSEVLLLYQAWVRFHTSVGR